MKRAKEQKMESKSNIDNELKKKNVHLSIAKDFSKTPGGRFSKEGSFSGEEFRDKFLTHKYMEAVRDGVKLIIDLDGCMGYPSSFLDESFGGLARNYSKENVVEVLEFKCDDQPGLVDIILDMIKNGVEK